MNRSIWASAAILMAMTGTPAMADPRLDEKVYSPYVENHVLEVETRWGQEFGPGDLKGARTEFTEVEYGVNDRLSLAVVGQIERTPGAGDRVVGAGVEGVYYLGQIPKLGVDVGTYVEYKKGVNGEHDVGEGKLLFAKNIGRFQGLFNFIVERPFGAPRGEDFAAYGYAASATWRTVGPLRLGVEAFGDIGDDHGIFRRPQGAYLGPQVKWESKPRFLPVEVAVDAGWLAPVAADRTEAASQVRISLEFEKRF